MLVFVFLLDSAVLRSRGQGFNPVPLSPVNISLILGAMF